MRCAPASSLPSRLCRSRGAERGLARGRSPRSRRRLHYECVTHLALNAALRAAAPCARAAEAGDASRFSVTFVAAVALCLGGLGQCVQKCFSLDNKPKENDMSKRGRKRRDRRKNGANHGKRPNA